MATRMAFPTASGGTLSLTMAGPTTDYGYTSFGAASATTPGYVTESVPATACDSNGNCTYTFTQRGTSRINRNLMRSASKPAAPTPSWRVRLQRRA